MSYERFIIGTIVLLLRTAVVGIVIRLRAQYIPRVTVQPDSEKDDNGRFPTTPGWMSFSDMVTRVVRLEGWKGLLKGIVPIAFGDGIILLTTALIDSGIIPSTFKPLFPYLSVVYDVPLSILIIRAVTTTAELSFLDCRGAMHVLLSPAERRKPWSLYLTPGLVWVVLTQVARNEALIYGLLPAIDIYIPDEVILYGMSTRRLAWLVLMFLHHVCTSPLEVVKIRLAMQRNLAIPEDKGSDPQEKDEHNTDSTSIKLLHLRTDTDLPPYAGMYACEQTINKEEGFGTLFPGRVWWFTDLTNLLAIYGGLNTAPFS